MGKKLTDEVIEKVAELTLNSIHPINDIRGSASYRRKISHIISIRALQAIAHQSYQIPNNKPVLLMGHQKRANSLKNTTCEQCSLLFRTRGNSNWTNK